jgi:hypothetical protein
VRTTGVSGLQWRVKFYEETLVWLTLMGHNTSVLQGMCVGFTMISTQGPTRHHVLVPQGQDKFGRNSCTRSLRSEESYRSYAYVLVF